MRATSGGTELQRQLHPKFGGKFGTECLSTKLPLPNLLCAGKSVKLINDNIWKQVSRINNSIYRENGGYKPTYDKMLHFNVKCSQYLYDEFEV